MSREDLREGYEYVKEYVKANPKKVTFAIALCVAFWIGVYARGAFATVTCIGNVPGTLTCAESAAPPVEVPPIPPIADSCPVGTTRIKGQWGNSVILTSDYGGFGSQIIVVEVKVPLTWTSQTIKRSSWVEYIDGAVQRQASFSTKPCDFTAANALKTASGQVQVVTGQLGFAFNYKQGSPASTAVTVVPGQTYYINIRNIGCTGSCNMRGGLPD